MSYNVSFRYTAAAGGYQGIITWTSFASKKDFDEWYTEERRAHQEVVEEGISEERAVELTCSTPLKCRLAAAKQEATYEDGTFDEAIFEMELANVAFVEQHDANRLGIINRGDSGDGIWENGWILPDGQFINCGYLMHIRCAEDKFGKTEEELEKTAVKVACLPASLRIERMRESGKKEYHPHFLTQRNRMTKAQLKTIERYCVKHGFRPPSDYFIQQGLSYSQHLMVTLSSFS
jgi:hypothetical protein